MVVFKGLFKVQLTFKPNAYKLAFGISSKHFPLAVYIPKPRAMPVGCFFGLVSLFLRGEKGWAGAFFLFLFVVVCFGFLWFFRFLVCFGFFFVFVGFFGGKINV